MTVMALGRNRNAQMIADLAEVGYLLPDCKTYDPTFGLGNFWTEWAPSSAFFVGSDIVEEKSPHGRSVDFCNTYFDDGQFEQITFDPPYRLAGTAGGKMDDNYGIGEYLDWRKRHRWICRGITEMTRILDPKDGVLVIKCMDQVCSGSVRWQTREFAEHAENLGLRLVDSIHVESHRPQPEGRKQVHVHRGYSTALVLTSHRSLW